jgi:hypothetical protein
MRGFNSTQRFPGPALSAAGLGGWDDKRSERGGTEPVWVGSCRLNDRGGGEIDQQWRWLGQCGSRSRTRGDAGECSMVSLCEATVSPALRPGLSLVRRPSGSIWWRCAPLKHSGRNEAGWKRASGCGFRAFSWAGNGCGYWVCEDCGEFAGGAGWRGGLRPENAKMHVPLILGEGDPGV